MIYDFFCRLFRFLDGEEEGREKNYSFKFPPWTCYDDPHNTFIVTYGHDPDEEDGVAGQQGQHRDDVNELYELRRLDQRTIVDVEDPALFAALELVDGGSGFVKGRC